MRKNQSSLLASAKRLLAVQARKQKSARQVLLGSLMAQLSSGDGAQLASAFAARDVQAFAKLWSRIGATLQNEIGDER